MKGTDILENAREQLKGFIAYEVRNIWCATKTHLPNWGEDEEYRIPFSEIVGENTLVKATLDVFDDADTSTPQLFTLDDIRVALDNNLFFGDEDGEEHHYGELKVDELANIANMLEEKYLSIVHKDIVAQ